MGNVRAVEELGKTRRRSVIIAEQRILPPASTHRLAATATNKPPCRPLGGKSVVEGRPFKGTKTRVDRVELVGTPGTDENSDGVSGDFDDKTAIHVLPPASALTDSLETVIEEFGFTQTFDSADSFGRVSRQAFQSGLSSSWPFASWRRRPWAL